MADSLKRVSAIIRKESLHVLRDPQALAIVLLLPAVMMFLYGYALKTEVKEIPIAVTCSANTPAITHIIESLDAGDLFTVSWIGDPVSEPIHLFQKYRVRALIRFPATFSSDLHSMSRQAAVQVLIDGSDPNLGTIIRNSAEKALSDPALDFVNFSVAEPIYIKQSILYNPKQESALYFVPGLMVIILTMISALLTSVALTKEKENGTLDQLSISPLKPREIVSGKLVPYFFLAGADGFLVLLIGRIVFNVSVRGSILLLAGISVIYIFICLLIGLLISTITRQQLHAMFLTIIATMMPSVILTGFIFPVRSMPPALQFLSLVLPATHFLTIVRGIMLKGVGVEALWQPIAVLSGMLVLLFTVSIIRVSKSL